MNEVKHIETTWVAKSKLIVTRITGEVDVADIDQWEKSLIKTLNQLEDNASFKIFINMVGFKAVDLEAHKKFRTIIPMTVACYGWRVGYLGLFEEESRAIKYKNIRGIKCIGAAHAHHDETKMSLYQAKFSSQKEQFFADSNEAMQWISALD